MANESIDGKIEGTPDITLIYGAHSMSIWNNPPGYSLDISGIELVSGDMALAATDFDTPYLGVPLNEFTVGSCLQTYDYAENDPGAPPGCYVRASIINLPVRERDWVVVGATEKEMLDLGFRKVGRDFPVFLHPGTAEEYALARTERKTGPGHQGFVCHASPDVTLAEDLQRRDLTINALAMDEAGELVDPWGGVRDLETRVLRHVSDAFSEDPLLAQTFLQEFVANEEVMQQIFDADPRPSAYIPVRDAIEDEDLAAFAEAGANGLAMPAIPAMSAVWDSWGNAVTLVTQQGEEPAAAFQNAAEQIRAAIAE